jgi:repressor LexA
MRTGVRGRAAVAHRDLLGSRQRAVLGFIHDYVLQHGYPPSVREIAQGVGLASPSSVQHHLAELESKGYVFRRRDTLRTIQVIDPGLPQRPVPLVPLVGRVAAGDPLLAVENIEDYVAVPAGSLRGSDGCFALRVSGDSMRDAGILDGDLVILRPVADVSDGTIGAVQHEDPQTGEFVVTVKRIYREPGGLRLEPANPAFPAQHVKGAHIAGVLVALTRTY